MKDDHVGSRRLLFAGQGKVLSFAYSNLRSIYIAFMLTISIIILATKTSANFGSAYIIAVFTIYSIFICFSRFEAKGMIIDFSSVLFYSLYMLSGDSAVFILIVLYFLVCLTVSKYKYNMYKVTENSIEFFSNILMIYFSSLAARSFKYFHYGSIEVIILQILSIFIITNIAVKAILFPFNYFAVNKVFYRVKLIQYLGLSILPNLICGILSYFFISIKLSLDSISAYGFLLLICAVLYISGILKILIERNNEMAILHKMTHSLMNKGEFAKRLQDMLDYLKGIIDYNFVGIYVFKDKKLINYPVAYKSKYSLDIDKLRFAVKSDLYGDLFNKGIYMREKEYAIKELKNLTENMKKDENIILLPLKESESVIGSVVLISPIKLRQKKFKTDLLSILAEHLSLAIMNEDKFNRLNQLANTDGLTSLVNYRGFKEHLRRLITEKKYFSMAIFDIDDFKKINDSFGHLAGDEVLKSVANIIAENVRFMDIVCRYGGEEFAVIFNGISYRDSALLCETIRRKVEMNEFTYETNKFNVTVSCGISEYRLGEENNEEHFFKRTDEALYSSKRSGKNRITLN